MRTLVRHSSRSATYAPHAVEICLNGNEWVKRQLRQRGIRLEALDNGLLACEDPSTLREICDQLGPAQTQAFFDKWQSRLPWRLTDDDRKAGYRDRLSNWQVEFTRAQAFHDPVRGHSSLKQSSVTIWTFGGQIAFSWSSSGVLPERRLDSFAHKSFRRTSTPVCTPTARGRTSRSVSGSTVHCAQRQRSTTREALALVRTSLSGFCRLFGLPFLQCLGRQIIPRLLDAQHIGHDGAL